MVQFRSETMVHGTLIIPADRAHEFIDLLGRKTNIHIVDMNETTATRQYKKYIQRIDEMERILRFLFEEINKLPGAVIEKNQIDSFLEYDSSYHLDRVEESLQKLYQQFVKFRENNDNLQAQKLAAIEEKAVAIAATRSLLPDLSRTAPGTPSDITRQGLLELDVEQQEGEVVGFSTIAGIISQAEQEKFARIVHRATRGNAFTHFETIQDQINEADTVSSVMKNVFVIYFQGTSESAVAERIMRICRAFALSNYTWPRTYREAEGRIGTLIEVIVERSKALKAYEEYFVREIAVLLDLVRVNGNSLVEEWRLFCVKEKAIYATLNLFEGSDATLRGDCWYPSIEDASIREILITQSNSQQVSAFLLTDNRPLPKNVSPPTYFRCPEFTQGFQDFVDTYGVARYKEANPALLTIVTLPFLFGIMYGDLGHGSIILIAGIYMVVMWHRQLKYTDQELIQMIGGGRYLVLMMGLFAVYAGFMYNDFFALGMDIFGTRYKKGDILSDGKIVMVRDETKGQYPWGLDPVWKGATNEIDFVNSFKMKFSVIIAFIQMGAGILHKAANAIYHKDNLTFWFEFIPQILFLLCLVGYMDFLIVYKWSTPLDTPKPYIITTIINIFFMNVEDPIWPYQKKLQLGLLVVMVLSIPWMLFPKPLLLKRQHAKVSKRRSVFAYQSQDETNPLKNGKDTQSRLSVGGGSDHGGVAISPMGGHEEEEFDFAEELIHQMIETIEFVLGTISNTASYLRLWALSLAHQQLALVFFDNIMLKILELNINVVIHGFLLFLAFSFFACATLAVMIFMDSLECFLHALRLQWVEFQNKFYKADGYAFVGFRFDRELTSKE